MFQHQTLSVEWTISGKFPNKITTTIEARQSTPHFSDQVFLSDCFHDIMSFIPTNEFIPILFSLMNTRLNWQDYIAFIMPQLWKGRKMHIMMEELLKQYMIAWSMFKELPSIEKSFEIQVNAAQWVAGTGFISCCKNFLSKVSTVSFMVPAPMNGIKAFKHIFSANSQVTSFHLIDQGNSHYRKKRKECRWNISKQVSFQAPKLHTLEFKTCNRLYEDEDLFNVESFKAMSHVQISFPSLKKLVVDERSFERQADGRLDLTSPNMTEKVVESTHWSLSEKFSLTFSKVKSVTVTYGHPMDGKNLGLIFPNCDTLTVDFHEWLLSRPLYEFPHLNKLNLRVKFDNQAMVFWYNKFVSENVSQHNIETEIVARDVIEIPNLVTTYLQVLRQYWPGMKGFQLKKLFDLIIVPVNTWRNSSVCNDIANQLKLCIDGYCVNRTLVLQKLIRKIEKFQQLADMADMEEEYYDDVLSALLDYVVILEVSEEEYMLRDREMDNMYWKLDELIAECLAIINDKEEDVEEEFEEIEEDMIFKRKLSDIMDTTKGSKIRKLEFAMNLTDPTCNN